MNSQGDGSSARGKRAGTKSAADAHVRPRNSTSRSPDLAVSAAHFGRLVNLSDRHVRRLRRDGVLPGTGNRYSLAQCMPPFIEHLRTGSGGAQSLTEARLKLSESRRRSVDLQNATRTGQLIYADQVAEVLAELGATLAGLHDALPGRLAAEIAGMTDPAAIRALLLGEMRKIRQAVADAAESMADRMGRAK